MIGGQFIHILVIPASYHQLEQTTVFVAPLLSLFLNFRHPLKQDNIYLVQCTIRFILTAKPVSHCPLYSYGDLCINYRKILSVP
jgi:hypothetical protein